MCTDSREEYCGAFKIMNPLEFYVCIYLDLTESSIFIQKNEAFQICRTVQKMTWQTSLCLSPRWNVSHKHPACGFICACAYMHLHDLCVYWKWIDRIYLFLCNFFCLFVFNSELCFWDVYLWVGGGKKEISVQIQPIYFRNNCFVVFPWSVDKCSSISLSVCTVRDS